jgi:putative ABC transport system permease protein
MKAINKKLWRDLWHIRGQVLAIAFVIMSGLATYLMAAMTYHNLQLTRSLYYQQYHFADVFANLMRAPNALLKRIENIPGVNQVEGRVQGRATVDVPDFNEPVSALVVSIPDSGDIKLNQLYLQSGRLVNPWSNNEIVIAKSFADTQFLNLGDKIALTIKGKRELFKIVGIAYSPEYIYQVRIGGFIPDYKRYTTIWMGYHAFSRAYEMQDAFNNVTLSVTPSVDPRAVLEQVDHLLAPYGGTFSYLRKDQISNKILDMEIDQLKRLAIIFPTVFMSVSMFLLNVVVSRMVTLQHEQIATLRAFGFEKKTIFIHYIQMVTVITLIGLFLGTVLGIKLSRWLSHLYETLFQFPFLYTDLRFSDLALGIVLNTTVILIGTTYSVYKAAKVSPAEGMRAETPSGYRHGFWDYPKISHWFYEPTRMIFRNIFRHPIKAMLTVTGLTMCGAILMMGQSQTDCMKYMVQVQFRMQYRDDLAVNFTDPTSIKVLDELRSLPGVYDVQGYRWIFSELRNGPYSNRTPLTGVEPEGHIHTPMDQNLNVLTMPNSGVLMTDYLANMLHIKPGELLSVQVLEGKESFVQVPVVGLVKDYLGVNVYMPLDQANRLIGEGHAVSGAYLSVDKSQFDTVYALLKKRPRVSNVIIRNQEIINFLHVLAESLLGFTRINTLLAATIALGVIYNSGMIALSERSRELASLRILGFTKGEVAYILLGELSIYTLISLPLGLYFGTLLCEYLTHVVASELFRVPLVINNDTYAYSASVVIVSAIFSGLVLLWKLSHIDLVSLLKTRE